MMEAAVGNRVLGEVEETTFDELLTSLRASLITASGTASANATVAAGATASNTPNSKLRVYPIPPLNDLVARHFRATQSAPLSVSGRYLPLLYVLVATLIASPHNKAVVVVDVERRFDITRVLQSAPDFEPPSAANPDHHDGHTLCEEYIPPGPRDGVGSARAKAPKPRVTVADLAHVQIYRPARGSRFHIADVVASAEEYMLYGSHGSRSREWWGTAVLGGGGQSGEAAVLAGWKGWLRVDREEVRGFGVGMSVEEALVERDTRQRSVEGSRWFGSSVWGDFSFSPY